MVKFKVPLKDILQNAYYQYELTSSNYNPTIDTTITITCTCRNVRGNPIANKELELFQNGLSQGTQTTNANGIATWTVGNLGGGIHNYTVEDATLTINVNDWKTITLTNGTLYVNEANRTCELHYSKSNVAFSSANTWIFIETVSQIGNYPPVDNNNYYISANPTILTRVYATGSIQARNTVTSGSATVQFNAMWHY